MKKILFTLAFIVSFSSFGQEISLFNSEGNAVAYIDTDDKDNTIYLWNGTPVAYLYPKSNYYNIYGFNGNHLGWYEKGIVCDEEGDAVGFKKGAVSGIYTNYEPYKQYKQYKPYKAYKSYAPYKPYFSKTFSNQSFVLFLKRGI